MKEGSIILTPVPQADGKLKLRPALVLRIMPAYNDLLVCGISTQIHHFILGFDEIVKTTDNDFKKSCLIQASLIRLSFLAIIQEKNITGSIGNISNERHKRLLKNLSTFLMKGIGKCRINY